MDELQIQVTMTSAARSIVALWQVLRRSEATFRKQAFRFSSKWSDTYGSHCLTIEPSATV